MSENKRKTVYGYCGASSIAINEFWRSAFISEICGMRIPEDIEIRQLSSKQADDIRFEKYTEALAHVLILFGAGYVDYDVLSDIAKDSERYTDLIFDTENFLIDKAKENPDDRVSDDIVRSAFMCAYNSVRYEQIQQADFKTALKLHGNTKLTVSGGFVFPKDKEFLMFLVKSGEPAAHFDRKAIEILSTESIECDFKDEKESYISLIKDDNKEFPRLPFIPNILNAVQIAEIYGKPYAADYIKYVRENRIPFDENFPAKYEEYITKDKLHFTVSVISKKRNICGDVINWFDYGATEYEKNLIRLGEEFDRTYETDLDIEIYPHNEPSEEQLINMAAVKFLDGKIIADKTVIEITHSGKKYLFAAYENNRLEPLDSKTFRTVPFDYNNLWTVIMEWSHSRKIVKKNNKITIPPDEWEKIPLKDREYARRLIEEQYRQQRGQNGMIQHLSDLKAYAAKKYGSREARDKGQAELRAEHQKGENNSENSDP
ncbi:MAG: hypothetical protein NC120_06575 [Ruminococcus sp.]|nr:hypothetical protein [Ruminococcus sp.]